MDKLSKFAWNLYQVSMFETYEKDNQLQRYETRQLVFAREREEAKQTFVMERALQNRISEGTIRGRIFNIGLSGISDQVDFVVRHKYLKIISQTVGPMAVIKY